MSEREARRHLDIRIATYNIHRCRGMDRRTMPSRIADVIRSMDADVVALQEVIGAGPSGEGQAEEIGAALGMGWVMHSVRQLRNHHFGNVVLSRFPVVHHGHYDLSWRTCEERACQRVDLDLGGDAVLHVYNVHLGTAVLERRYQAARLAAFVHDHRIKGPKVILGDFNEWMKGLATRTLSALFKSIDIAQHLKRKRTYPGFFPLLHLDHIYYEGEVTVRSLELVRTRKALVASDHLPLVADLRIGF
ncbi:MAG TPA: endonuclease/exonuclease/phosphatase family protein [Vicinamibacterales bacterium]|nr:endonuclease/exonuclease/phosphatase family protein [Vicinamibacterales bacterium]